jgi:hypothetical protein
LVRHLAFAWLARPGLDVEPGRVGGADSGVDRDTGKGDVIQLGEQLLSGGFAEAAVVVGPAGGGAVWRGGLAAFPSPLTPRPLIPTVEVMGWGEGLDSSN